MPGIEQVKLRVGQIAQIGRRPLGGENIVVLSPCDERRRLRVAEILLPLGIEGWVGAVAVEQIELDLLATGTVQ